MAADIEYVTRDGDMVDRIVFDHYGSTGGGLVEAVLSCNVGLSDLGLVLPAGVVLRLPGFGTEAEVEQLITLWG